MVNLLSPQPQYIINRQMLRNQEHFPAIDLGMRMFNDDYPLKERLIEPTTTTNLIQQIREEQRERIEKYLLPYTTDLGQQLAQHFVEEQRGSFKDIFG